MVRASLVFVVAVYFISVCFGDPLPDVAHAAITNSYYITTWDLIGAGAGHTPVENSVEGVEALHYLDGTQTLAIVVHGRGGSAFSEFGYTLRDALSPAGEGWDLFSPRLRSTDAQFVEVIHTDAVGNRAFGMVVTEGVGTLDFFPNGATRQPGCSFFDNACYHNRAWKLFAATVQMGGHLIGTKCNTFAEALNNRCTAFGTATMGTNALVKTAQGIFRMNTGRVWPYAL